MLLLLTQEACKKEAYFHKVPCVTVRTETEWQELVNIGWNKLADPDNKEIILKTIISQLNFKCNNQINLYGDGKSI